MFFLIKYLQESIENAEGGANKMELLAGGGMSVQSYEISFPPTSLEFSPV